MFDLKAIAEKLALSSKMAGADAVDISVANGVSVSVSTLDGKLETAERSESLELDLRVLVGQRQAVVSSSDPSEETIDEMAQRAVAMAKEAPEDDSLGLADPEDLAKSVDEDVLDLYDEVTQLTPQQLEEMSLRAESSAAAVSGVTQVQSSGAGYTHSRRVVLQSNGFGFTRQRSSFSVGCAAIAGAGTDMTRDGDGDGRTHFADLRDVEEIGRTAGERAVAMQGAKRPRSGRYPVVFDERVSSSLIGHLIAAINGQAILRGASWARDLEGEQILPNNISLVEMPHRRRLGSSRMFDAEGLATSERALVDEGVLTGWVTDLGTARRLGRRSTANAARGGSGPVPSVGNVTLSDGVMSRSELLKDTGTCILVTSLIGSTINPNTGDYSRGASGFFVENGEITYPIQEFTLAGNLIEMLRTITPANDARLYLPRQVPSLRVEGLAIAGDD